MFFADEPDPLDAAAMEEPPRDPRHGPAEDELPGVLGYGLRWGSSANAVVALEAARVFSDGVMFQVGRQLRRGDLSVRAFQQLVHEDHFYASDEDRLPDAHPLCSMHPHDRAWSVKGGFSCPAAPERRSRYPDIAAREP